MKRLFLIFLFLLMACPAWGATKTVCASGCDYTTIAGAQTGATVGDTINVSTGTYNENNLSFSKALTWVAIDGNGTVTITNSGTGTYVARILSSISNITITGFVFDGLGTKTNAMTLNASSTNNVFNYCTFRDAIILINLTTAAANFNSCTFTGTINYVFSGSASTLNVNNSTFSVTVGNTFGYITSGTITFNNNTVTIAFDTGEALWDFNGTGITLTSTNNTIALSGATMRIIRGERTGTNGTVTISDTITSSATYSSNGFLFTSPGWTIDINQTNIKTTNSDYTGTLFSFTNQINPKIRNSIIDLSSSTSTNEYCPIGIHSTGIDATNNGTVHGVTITNNTIYTNNKSGYIIAIGQESSSSGDNKLDNALVTGNKLYGYAFYNPLAEDGSVHALFYGHSKNGIILNNYINGGGYGIVIKGSPVIWSSGGVFYNTIINTSTQESILLKGAQGVSVFNNVLYDNNAGTYLLSVHENGSGQEAINNNIKNNILMSDQSHMVYLDDDALTGFSCDNNIYYKAGGGALIFTVGADVNNYSEWLLLGYDANSYNSDPLFISATNFHLQSGSPARNAGVDVGLVSKNPPDIGAEPYLQYVPWFH